MQSKVNLVTLNGEDRVESFLFDFGERAWGICCSVATAKQNGETG